MRLTSRLSSLDPERRRYTLETLVGHLDAAHQHDRMHSLFANPDWMHARVESGGYRYDGYLEDVEIAFSRVSGDMKVKESSIVEALRLSLISSTVIGLAGSLPVSLVAEAVKRSIWPAERAIGAASTMSSSLDRQSLGWALLAMDHLEQSERAELQNLVGSDTPVSSSEVRQYWTEMREAMDDRRGRWVTREVVDRCTALLCTVEPFLTVARDVGGAIQEAPVRSLARQPEDPAIRAEKQKLAKSNPRAARLIELAKLRYLLGRAGRGFEAIRSVPGFGDAERSEAAALLKFSLGPQATVVGLPKRALKKRARLVDADTVVRIARSVDTASAQALVEAVGRARAQLKHIRGNPNRARALAALADPAKAPKKLVGEALEELARCVKKPAGAARKAGKPRGKWRGVPLDVADLDSGETGSVRVFFDDCALVDEGVDQAFSSYVEDLSDLEAEFAGFAAAVEDLVNAAPDDLLLDLLALAVSPLRDYGWVSVRAVSALAPRLTGDLHEIRDDVLDRALETLELLPVALSLEQWRYLAPVLSDGQIEQALRTRRDVHDDPAQVRALGAVARRTGGGRGRQQASGYLDRAAQQADPEGRLRTLQSIAMLLDETTEERAVELAQALDSASRCMKAVAVLAPHLSQDVRALAVEWAFQLGDEALPDNNFEDAQLAEAWAALLPFLPAEQRCAGLRLAVGLVTDQALPSDFKRGVQQLGPFLDDEAVERLEAYQWRLAEELSVYLQSSAGHLLTPDRQAQLLDRIEALPSARDRLECMLQLVSSLPQELRTRCADAAWELAVAAEEDSAAALAEHVSPDRLTATLLTLDYASPFALRLVSAASDQLPPRAVDVIMAAVAQSPHRLDYMAALAGQLDEASRHEVLRWATSIAQPERSRSAIRSLLRYMDPPDRRAALASRLATLRRGARADLLTAVAEDDFIAAFPDGGAAIAESIVEICQEWTWL